MTTEELKHLFDQFSDDIDFDYPPPSELMVSTRGDLNALLLLDKLLPVAATYHGLAPDLISCAEHDQLWLATDVEELAKVITREQVQALVFFGVFYHPDVDSLSMFV